MNFLVLQHVVYFVYSVNDTNYTFPQLFLPLPLLLCYSLLDHYLICGRAHLKKTFSWYSSLFLLVFYLFGLDICYWKKQKKKKCKFCIKNIVFRDHSVNTTLTFILFVSIRDFEKHFLSN